MFQSDGLNDYATFGHYQVSRNGNFYDTRRRKIVQKRLRSGKYIVRLHMDDADEKKTTVYYVHRLMYKLFVSSDLTDSDYVLPRDGNYLNIAPDNLVKKTRSECRSTKQWKSGRKPLAIPPEIKSNVLSDRASGLTYSQLKAKYNISYFSLSKIIHEKY